MPYAVNDGVRIHYEVAGDGPPLVLHPGYVGCAEDWADAGYLAALENRYRMIRIDPRGQGRSDKPHDPAAYTRHRRVGDVLAVLDAVGVDRAHYWGYSMGGWIGFQLGAAAPDRLRSLVLGGANPFEGNPRPPERDRILTDLRGGMEAFVRAWEAASPDCWATPGERERWLAADADALAAGRRQRLSEPDLSAEAVAAIRVPALLYLGTADAIHTPDAVERVARLMPSASFIPLDGLDHGKAWNRGDLVAPHVLAFLERTEEALAT